MFKLFFGINTYNKYLFRIHTGKQHIIHISDLNIDSLDNDQFTIVKNEITAVLTYGELLCDLYFQFKISNKPLEGRYKLVFFFISKTLLTHIVICVTMIIFNNTSVHLFLKYIWRRLLFIMDG